MSGHRIGAVLKEFNIGITTLRTFLRNNGIVVENSPNVMLDNYSYSLINRAFASQKQIKEKANSIKQKDTFENRRIALIIDNHHRKTPQGYQIRQKLHSYAIKAIEEGGFDFFYNKEDGQIRKGYKRFEDTDADEKLKGKMLHGCYDKKPLTIIVEGLKIRRLLWDKTSECIRVFSQAELRQIRGKEKPKKENPKENTPPKKKRFDIFDLWASKIGIYEKHKCGKPFKCSCCGKDFGIKEGWRIESTEYCICNNCMKVINEKRGIKPRRTSKGEYLGEIDYSRQPWAKIIYTPMGNKR